MQRSRGHMGNWLNRIERLPSKQETVGSRPTFPSKRQLAHKVYNNVGIWDSSSTEELPTIEGVYVGETSLDVGSNPTYPTTHL